MEADRAAVAQAEAGREVERSRGGWRPKLHLVVYSRVLPLAAVVYAGESHEATHFIIEGIEKVLRLRWIALLSRRVIERVIPQRSDQIRYEGPRRLDRIAYQCRARVSSASGGSRKIAEAAHSTTDSALCGDTSEFSLLRIRPAGLGPIPAG